MTGTTPEIRDEHLQGSYRFCGALDSSALPDLYVSLIVEPQKTDQSPITNSHDETRRLPDSEWAPQTLDEWLRSGIAKQLHREGVDVCHPWQGHAVDADEINWRILPKGYHKPGTCADEGRQCLLHELWGGPEYPGQLHRHPITFSAATPTDHSEEGVALGGVWQFTLREIRPEYIGLITSAICALAATRRSFTLDLGDVHTFSVDVREATVINPLYSPAEIQAKLTSANVSSRMSGKRILWVEEVRNGFTEALSDRLELDAFSPPEVGHDAQ